MSVLDTFKNHYFSTSWTQKQHNWILILQPH